MARRGRPRKGPVMAETEKKSDVLDDLESILKGVGASIAEEEPEYEPTGHDVVVVPEDVMHPADMGAALDVATSVALAQAEEGFVEPEPTVMDGDADDPFDVRSFRTCMNAGCDFRAGCLRWRLRKQRGEYQTAAMFFADQDQCLVRADQYMNKFALDPIEDW